MKETSVFCFRDEELSGCPVKEKLRLVALSGFHYKNYGLAGKEVSNN